MDKKQSLDTSFKIFDIANAGRPSFSLVDDDLMGKESLGILPPDFADRDSLFNFSQLDVSSNRESLGILQISNFMERESLGNSFSLLNSNPVATPQRDFLKPVDTFCQKSSTSSINSTNFDQIEFPSKIYKYSLQDLTGVNANNILNDTINNSKDLFSQFKRTVPLPSNSLMNNAQIVDFQEVQADLSLPENLLERNKHESYVVEKFRKFSVDICQMDKEVDVEDDVFLNTSVMVEANYIASKIADGSIYDETCKDTGMLDDTPQPDWQESSAENSKNSSNKENDKEQNIKEIVFKNIDKLLPSVPNQPLKIKTASSQNEQKPLVATEPVILLNNQELKLNENKTSPDNKEDNCKNNSNNEKESINEEKNMSRKRTSSTRLDNKEILQNLSQISVLLNTSRKSDSKKTEAQQLINNLTDLLLTNSSDSGNLDDSGHSSVQSEEVFEVLDLSTTSKIAKEPMGNNLQALDLSVKIEGHNQIPLMKKMSRSFSVGSSKPISNEARSFGSVVNKKSFVFQKNASFNSMKSNQASSSTSGTYDSSNNYSGNGSNKDSSNNLVHSNLRTIKSTSSIKKGPLKALHPVIENKDNLPKTPKRDQNKTSYLHPKRTSTPIKEPNIRPMAQSTPTLKIKTRSKESSISPVTATMKSKYSINKSKSEATTGKIPKLNYSRHHSVTEDSGKTTMDKSKKENELKGNPVRARSNSLGKENRIFSALSKVRQNILASPYYKTSTKSSEDTKDKAKIPVLKEKNANIK